MSALADMVSKAVERSNVLFSDSVLVAGSSVPEIRAAKLARKLRSDYTQSITTVSGAAREREQDREGAGESAGPLLLTVKSEDASSGGGSDMVVHRTANEGKTALVVSGAAGSRTHVPKPKWHAPWELSAVISGHLGWVRAVAFDPSNEWFVTGSADRTIKVWDFAKCCAGSDGGLKLTLTGHIDTIRGLAVSPRHPYMFSVGEDKLVKCWDLEHNKVIRHYHGHLSAVYCVTIHPTLDILITGGRDSTARVWDMRTKQQVHLLGGHKEAVGTVVANSVDPQVITGSYDSTVKLWDLAAGKAMTTLTHHKKAVRAIAVNPREFSFISASADNIKKWQCRDGRFLKNFSGHNSVVNALAINEDGVAFSGGDNGSMCFWDYDTGHCFQRGQTTPQSGSLDAEAGVFASTFDYSGTRLVTCEADKSIKIWQENQSANSDTHPIDMVSWESQCLKLSRH
jgi:pleiotropic regulator 1